MVVVRLFFLFRLGPRRLHRALKPLGHEWMVRAKVRFTLVVHKPNSQHPDRFALLVDYRRTRETWFENEWDVVQRHRQELSGTGLRDTFSPLAER